MTVMADIYLNVFIGVMVIGLPILFVNRKPKAINSLYGYRSGIAMKSQEAWDYAQNYWTKVLLIISIAIVALQVILCFTLADKAIAGAITLFIWMIGLITSIFLTEQELKKKFSIKQQ